MSTTLELKGLGLCLRGKSPRAVDLICEKVEKNINSYLSLNFEKESKISGVSIPAGSCSSSTPVTFVFWRKLMDILVEQETNSVFDWPNVQRELKEIILSSLKDSGVKVKDNKCEFIVHTQRQSAFSENGQKSHAA